MCVRSHTTWWTTGRALTSPSATLAVIFRSEPAQFRWKSHHLRFLLARVERQGQSLAACVHFSAHELSCMFQEWTLRERHALRRQELPTPGAGRQPLAPPEPESPPVGTKTFFYSNVRRGYPAPSCGGTRCACARLFRARARPDGFVQVAQGVPLRHQAEAPSSHA